MGTPVKSWTCSAVSISWPLTPLIVMVAHWGRRAHTTSESSLAEWTYTYSKQASTPPCAQFFAARTRGQGQEATPRTIARSVSSVHAQRQQQLMPMAGSWPRDPTPHRSVRTRARLASLASRNKRAGLFTNTTSSLFHPIRPTLPVQPVHSMSSHCSKYIRRQTISSTRASANVSNYPRVAVAHLHKGVRDYCWHTRCASSSPAGRPSVWCGGGEC